MSWRDKTRDIEPAAYFIGLAMMAASLTLSPFLMSVSQFFLLAVWLFLGDPVKVKLQRFLHDKVALVLVSLYVLHLIGLVYTSDFQYALKDLRTKLPLVTFPLILSSTKPLERRYTDLLMAVYILSVLVATGVSFNIYLRHDYTDVREIAQHVSHIRICLNIVLCIGILGYYLFAKPTPLWARVLALALAVWFLYQLYIFESISGYLAFVGMVAAALLYLFFTKVRSKGWRAAMAVAVVALPLVAGIVLYRTVTKMLYVAPVDLSTLEHKTAQGNDYWHDTIQFPTEDGHYVGLYLCPKELRESWNRRSTLDYDGKTLNGENLEATLIRYMASKELRKDSVGMAALDEQDIRNVEQGVANYVNWSHPGLYARLSETLFEYGQYRRYDNPNGGSLSQRIEYTKASLYLIRQHPLFGVGTGDIPNAYQQAYDDIQSPLRQEFRHKAHNQYLSITVGFGIIGLLWFLVVLFYPYLASKRNRTYFYTIFMVILLISMFPEDTIESQAGVSFYAFFNSLFIFAFKNRESHPERQ
ncbi:MAG: O-antigen ligase family protein [Bacteroidales bacterium]|nr:O-antigen ligase family protein [Bacteroidales bacterium]